jgi:hypothetical protein
MYRNRGEKQEAKQDGYGALYPSQNIASAAKLRK